MSDIEITARLNAETVERLDAVAGRRGTTRDRLLSEFIDDGLADDEQLREFLEVGRRQIAAGDFITHEELVAEIDRRKRDRKAAA